jgi:tetratricopeptide (TPR) repeat protein
LTKRGQYDEALKHYDLALAADPNFSPAHYNLGLALYDLRRFGEAVDHYREALKQQSDNPELYNNLGNALRACRRTDEAISQFEEAIRRKPDYAAAHFHLAMALADKSQIAAAEVHCRRAIALRPDLVLPHVQLGRFLAQRQEWFSAIEHYRYALRLKPDCAEALSDLAELMATCPDGRFRNGVSALDFARRADRICGGRSPEALRSLAAAQAELGQFAEAAATARAALELAKQQRKEPLAAILQSDIARIEAQTPH